MPARYARLGFALLLAVMAVGLAPGAARADDEGGWLDQVEWRYLLKLQASINEQEPADSSLNPNNDVLQIPSRNLNSQVRLDVNAELGPVAFFIKPRFVAEELRWDEGTLDGETESDTESYVNEWQLRLSIADRLYASYGRENLQWGPSYLFSPSNPLITDNGQDNPKREVPGLDYAKLLWVPNSGWSVSLIANLDEGEASISRNIDSEYNTFLGQVASEAQAQLDEIERQYQAGLAQIDQLRNSAPGTRGPLAQEANAQADALDALAAEQQQAAIDEVNSTTAEIYQEAALQRDTYNRTFQRQYAAKVDYTTLQKYATAIASYQETDKTDEAPERIRLGGYAGWTASDAMLLYAEGSASLRGQELYPVEDASSPIGLRLAPTRLNEDDFRGVMLVGGTYTFLGGQTLVAEYLYNGAGYDSAEADRYYELRDHADNALLEPEPLPTLGLLTLAQAEDVGMRFIRRNYILLQYQQIQVVGNLGFILRNTFNLDDGSVQVIPILQYNVGDRWQVFAIMSHNFGSRDSEFTSVYDHAYQLGIEFTL
ncbi:MAG: hypothetical protein V1929_04140 [bacterium]